MFQAQRIYDTELAAAAAGRRVSTVQTPADHIEVPAIATAINLVRVAPARDSGDGGGGDVIAEAEERRAGQRRSDESPHNVEVADTGEVTDSTSARPRALWQSALRDVVATAASSTSSESGDSTRWQRTINKVTHSSSSLGCDV